MFTRTNLISHIVEQIYMHETIVDYVCESTYFNLKVQHLFGIEKNNIHTYIVVRAMNLN